MTRERWRRIDELFSAALRLDPLEREAWLRDACGDDDDLRAEVCRLLAEDERANRDKFLTLSQTPYPPPDRTESWHSRRGRRPPRGTDGTGRANHRGFSPKPAIVAGSRPHTISEAESLGRARLRELPMIYIAIVAIAAFWRRIIIKNEDLALYKIDAVVILALGGVIALLSARWRPSLAWIKVLELAVVGLFAGRLAVVQYRLMLMFSTRGSPMMAQTIMKNVVLLMAILILTYGLYVPKPWRRAALVAAPLAMLPFATLAVLSLQHPEEMAWLGSGWKWGETPWSLLFSFDALVLVILVVGASFGAYALSRLRRQVVEARQLGQYRLRRRIGGGGMGEVYLAEHQLLKRPCAVKLIRPDSVTDPRTLARFEREVRLNATLSHPNTVEIYDYGRTEDGTYYYVMEYLPGLSLAELVERHGPLPPGRAVYLLRQVCEALREAHEAGLIHRDIKTSNIIASRRGGMDDVAKLVDFGLVRPLAAPWGSALSEEGEILGTPMYMSPEQATGERELDARSDIYSLGAVAYHLLTGRPPFDEDCGIAVLIAHARDPVAPPSRVRPGIPEDLERVVLRCLAKGAADRFPDAGSLERALAACECAGDWNKECAARWWRDIGRV